MVMDLLRVPNGLQMLYMARGARGVTAGIVNVKELRKEMKALEEAGDMYSAYRVDHPQENASVWDWTGRTAQRWTTIEEYQCILGDMQLGQMYEQVHIRAPLSCGLLDGLMAPKERKDRPPRDPQKLYHRTAMITSILCYSRASEGSNKFPRVSGAFLYSNGVKRRILDLLHQFGLSSPLSKARSASHGIANMT